MDSYNLLTSVYVGWKITDANGHLSEILRATSEPIV
jgi:hypothetical protein